ncbi:hypothetical protein LTR53_017225 [Teratosphaeriaceae sp. CCFEE 6253]|nr:hypothetical protein LTR53_017225 [Teratosphaeriaceae sp. CCFEE 6253]
MGSPISPFVLMISVPAISTSVYSFTSMIMFLLANVLMMRCEMQTRGRSRSWRVQDLPSVNIPIVSSYVHATMDEFVVNDTYTGGNMRQSGVGNEFEGKDRRDRAIEVVPRNKFDLERLYTPLPDRGVVQEVSRTRSRLAQHPEEDRDAGQANESQHPRDDADDRAGGRDDVHQRELDQCGGGKEEVHGDDPRGGHPAMGTHEPSVANNEIKGRWAGWLTWMDTSPWAGATPRALDRVPHGHGAQVDRYVGELLREHVHDEGHDRLPDQDESARLKIEPGLDRPRSTSLTVYRNGSMQFTGSPIEIPVLYPSLIELIKMAITSEMVSLPSTMRRADVSTFKVGHAYSIKTPAPIFPIYHNESVPWLGIICWLVLPNASAIRMVWMPWYVAHALISFIVSMSKERSQEDPLKAAYLYLRRFRFIIADAMALA